MEPSEAINIVSFAGGVIVAVLCSLLAIWKWKIGVDVTIRENKDGIDGLAKELACLQRQSREQHEEAMKEIKDDFTKMWDKLNDIDRRVAHIEGKLEIGE